MYGQVSPGALDSMRSLYDQGVFPGPISIFHPLSPTPHVLRAVTLDHSHNLNLISGSFDYSQHFSHLSDSSCTNLITSSGIKKAKSRTQTPAVILSLIKGCE